MLRMDMIKNTIMIMNAVEYDKRMQMIKDYDLINTTHYRITCFQYVQSYWLTKQLLTLVSLYVPMYGLVQVA